MTVTWAEFAAVPGRMPQHLIEYWVHGKGAAKIRWGQPGDFNRCVRQLTKYFPRDPKGLCNRLHTRALGVPPGQEHTLDEMVFGNAAEEWQHGAEGSWAEDGFAISADERKRAAKKGEALPDGSYPIRNEDDLRNAIQSVGRAKEGDRAKVRAHIMKRARALKRPDLIPDDWKKGKSKAELEGLTADASDFFDEVDDMPDPDELAMFPTKKMWRGRLAPIGVPTGDRRKFEVGGIGHRDLPLPLLYQLQTADGHEQSVVVGRILGVSVNDEEAYGYGDWLDTEHTTAAQDRMASGIGGVSVDLDDVEYELRVPGTATKWLAAEQCSDETGECAMHEFVVTKGRIAAATIVAIPAFADAKLEIYEGVDEEGLLAAFDELPMAEDSESCGCGMAASAIQGYCTPVNGGVTAAITSFTPPRAAFEDPHFTALTGLTFDDKSYPGYIAVRGHIGDWKVQHMGLPGQKLPRSRSGYSYFHLAPIYTAEGDEVYTGKILYAGSHPSMEAGLIAAAQHYDTLPTAAFVCAGEDQFGVWVAGVLAPNLSDEAKLTITTRPPSGDWRYVGRDLEMIAVLAVGVPGFPVVRARSEGGRVRALVASAGPAPVRLDTWGPVSEEAVRAMVTRELARRDRLVRATAIQQSFAHERAERVRAAAAPFIEGGS